MEKVYAGLADLELLTDRANDLVEFRIDAVLHEMSTMTLIELPEDEPWTVDFFLENTQVSRHIWFFCDRCGCLATGVSMLRQMWEGQVGVWRRM